MLPLMHGPDPSAFAAFAVVVALGAGGALLAVAGFLGWGTLELICLIEHYSEA